MKEAVYADQSNIGLKGKLKPSGHVIARVAASGRVLHFSLHYRCGSRIFTWRVMKRI
jgi:hypothetical protein